jgi:hypothetical protein
MEFVALAIAQIPIEIPKIPKIPAVSESTQCILTKSALRRLLSEVMRLANGVTYDHVFWISTYPDLYNSMKQLDSTAQGLSHLDDLIVACDIGELDSVCATVVTECNAVFKNIVSIITHHAIECVHVRANCTRISTALTGHKPNVECLMTVYHELSELSGQYPRPRR